MYRRQVRTMFRATPMREPRSFLVLHRVLSCSNNIMISRLRGIDTDDKRSKKQRKVSSLLENEEIESDQNYSNVCAFRLFLLFNVL